MKTSKLPYWLFTLSILLAMPFVCLGQTNLPPVFDPGTEPLPSDPASYWKYAISLVTPLIVWGITKVAPQIPKMLLPVSTAFIGIALGLLMNAAGATKLAWMDMAQLGALAVFIRETWNQAITKGVMAKAASVPVALAMLLGLSALSPGCSTLNQTDSQRVASAAKVAAYVGTSTALRNHPEWLPNFINARNDLKVLETADSLDIAQILAIINRLPVKELKSDTAAIVITSATILISEYGVSEIPLEKLKQLQPIVTAIRQGIDLELATHGISP